MATIFLTVTCRKSAPYLPECVDSILSQTHKDWLAHIRVDDVECDGRETLHEAQRQAERDPRITVSFTDDRDYALKNQLFSIDRYCPHDAVVGKLDGDDRLSDPAALAAVMAEYADPELDILWTKFTGGKRPCCCGPLPEGVDVLSHGWKTSHFQTFRKRLLGAVRREAFIDPKTGRHWTCSCDHALYLPLLVHARKRKFLSRVCYFYRRGAGDNRSKAQQTTARRIREHNRREHEGYAPKNVVLFVNGPGQGRDKRFYSGERRPPMGMLSMAAHLRARGHHVRLIDRFLSGAWFPKPETIERADFVGFYISTPNAPDARYCMKRVREAGYKGVMAAGGPHTILWPDQVKRWGADLVCPGEADFTISTIVERSIIPDMPTRVTDLDSLPFVAYDLLAEQNILNKYSSTWPFTSSQRGVYTLNTSRGCPFGCEFCDVKTIWGRTYHAMSPERVLLDVQALRDRYGAKAIYFREDNFCCDPERVKRICELLPGPPLHWACEMRADLGADRAFVRMVADAGCRGFYIGAESGSDRMLGLMNKGITAAQIEATCDNAQKYGVYVALSMISGYPGETRADRAATGNMLKRVRARHVWKAKYRKPWSDYESSPVEDDR